MIFVITNNALEISQTEGYPILFIVISMSIYIL